jgi:hypothetical protein
MILYMACGFPRKRASNDDHVGKYGSMHVPYVRTCSGYLQGITFLSSTSLRFRYIFNTIGPILSMVVEYGGSHI